MWKALIEVRLKAGVLDPQGKAVHGGLQAMGYSEVTGVRVGKLIELWLQTPDRVEAERRVDAMCRRLLANPVIEEYRFQLQPASGAEGEQR